MWLLQDVNALGDDDENAAVDEDVLPDDEPPARAPKGRDRRGAVSAEVYDEAEAQNFEKIIIPKDNDTRKSLEQAMSKNLLFRHMESDEKTLVTLTIIVLMLSVANTKYLRVSCTNV